MKEKGDPLPHWQECISDSIMKNILKVNNNNTTM